MGKGRSFTRDHPLDEVVSALQKSIRRGEEEDAVYFAEQMLDRYPWYLLRRLGIIVMEDIGMANTGLVKDVLGTRLSLSALYRDARTLPSELRSFIGYPTLSLVARMAASQKSREADNLVLSVIRDLLNRVVEKDQEAVYRVAMQNLYEAILVKDAELIVRCMYSLCDGYATWWPAELPGLVSYLYGTGEVNEQTALVCSFILELYKNSKHYEQVPLGYLAILLSRSDKDESMSFHSLVSAAVTSLPRAVPDYALDNHTARGRAMGRQGKAGVKFFREVASVIRNEAYPSAWADAPTGYPRARIVVPQ